LPELPEVETVCRGLNQLTLDCEIQKAEVLLPRTLAYPVSHQQFESEIPGQKIAFWSRRGKYLLAHFTENKAFLGVHLRMTGQLLWLSQDSPLHKHTRVRLFFSNGQELRFVDTRTFGKMWWVKGQSPEAIITGLQKLGPEPFDSQFNNDYIAQNLKKSKRLIKTILLDQELVAGVGNIYADEALFQSGIHPQAIASSLTLAQVDKLRQAIIEVLSKSIANGGTTFSDFLHVTGVNGNYGGVAWVYGRTGQPCRVCETPIEKVKIGGRSSHFCPNCQAEVPLPNGEGS
jgi:formamidopyrimidine-DNA glycosylase